MHTIFFKSHFKNCKRHVLAHFARKFHIYTFQSRKFGCRLKSSYTKKNRTSTPIHKLSNHVMNFPEKYSKPTLMASLPVSRFWFSWSRRMMNGRPYSSKAILPGKDIILRLALVYFLFPQFALTSSRDDVGIFFFCERQSVTQAADYPVFVPIQ